MSKRKKIEITLTEEQIKKLQPLQDTAAEHSMEGVIVAQVWPDVGLMVCRWMRLDELAKSAEKAKRTGGLPIPERWIKRYFERTGSDEA
jgi:hypothetical protein